MPIRPSFKLEPSDRHGVVGVERVRDGVDIDMYDIGGLMQDDEPATLVLSCDEAIELASMLRAVTGIATENERASLTAADDRPLQPTPLGKSILEAASQHHGIGD